MTKSGQMEFKTKAGTPMAPAQVHAHLKNLTANAAKAIGTEVAAMVATGKAPAKAPPAHLVAEAKAKAEGAEKAKALAIAKAKAAAIVLPLDIRGSAWREPASF